MDDTKEFKKKSYYQLNKKERLAYQRKWYELNRAIISEYNRQYYLKKKLAYVPCQKINNDINFNHSCTVDKIIVRFD